jgi:TRAP-type C4-dicarboxylate transport system substrate-binding protein
MKKLFMILAALAIITTLIITGCSATSTPSTTIPPATTAKPATSAPATSSAPASSAPATSKPASSPSASSGTITLKFAFDMPKTGAIVPGWTWWAEQVQAKSNGRVKIDFYPAGALFDQVNTPDSLKAGVADMANISFANHANLQPVTNVFALPGLEFPDTKNGLMASYNAYLQLSQKYPVITNELADFKVLMWVPNPAYRIISKKQVTLPGDLKGMKLGGTTLQSQMVQLAGGASVQTAPPAMYETISKGVVEGGFVFWAQVSVYKLNEVVSYVLDYGFTQISQQICMNLKTWNSLPPDIQKLMMDLVPESIARSVDSELETSEAGIKLMKDNKKTITVLTPDQMKAWDTLVAPIQDNWVKTAQGAGASNAAALLSDLRTLRATALAAPVK